ncbi:MAG: hypothetical protein MRERC_6c072 [Mycoplasmataceae bacterium RC_NB112A]|nr:MAG: hypothetical protein MRERC_10c024 [Mycoplasmataceae bacterium RC_NB112A]KLL01959.1 MAG: hypothetical protein MRERC_6c049 [Mycoplasmataceae bacterium RC_NB112A]KLL01976.1 MAG: hypothetical protein MRERC_6c072 [Mycoplasmataceae bacterium RC_NB112A]
MTDNLQNIQKINRIEETKQESFNILGITESVSLREISKELINKHYQNSLKNFEYRGLNLKQLEGSKEFLIEYENKLSKIREIANEHKLKEADLDFVFKRWKDRIGACINFTELESVIQYEIKSYIETFDQIRGNLNTAFEAPPKLNEFSCLDLVLVIPAVIFMTSILIWLLSITQKNKDGL